jgi:hypothetical protein
MAERSTPQPSTRVAIKEEVRRLLARRYTQAQVAAELQITQQAVSKWKKKIEADAQAAAADRAVEIRATLDSLAEVEREAWAAWERSKRPAVERRRERGSGPEGPIRKVQRTTRYQIGDPSFLNLILGCQTQRRALLGLDAPTKAQEYIMQELRAGLERLRAHLPEPLFVQVAGLLAGDAGGVVPAA